MEARALKSSLLSQVAMKSSTQQVFIADDDVWCVTGLNNVTCDDFSVDDLLDFSDKDFKETFEEKHSSVSVDDDNNSSNSANSPTSADFAGQLTVPVTISLFYFFFKYALRLLRVINARYPE